MLKMNRFPIILRRLPRFGFSLVLLVGLAPQGQSATGPAINVRFLDSATGAAVQPETLEVRPHSPGASVQRLDASHVHRNGRAELVLPRGRHTLRAVSRTHRPLAGEFEVNAVNPYRLDFYLDPIAEPVEVRPETVQNLQRDGATLIQGFVVDDAAGGPLAGVQVASRPSGAVAHTDARGFFRFYVPVQSDTEAEQSPASLTFEKPGYGALTREHLELWSRGDWTYRVRLQPGGPPQVVDERTERRRPEKPAEAATAATAKPSAAENNATAARQPLANGPVPLATDPTNATIRVPRNIRVQRVSLGTIDYVTMNYYVRSVLPSEWIPSWGNYTGGSNSLNAGAIAARCYAIARLNAVSTASTYDICDTTSCQVFNPTKINSLTDTAVNYTENYVVVNGSGVIPGTEYSAENNSLGYPCGDGYTSPTGGCLYDPICLGEARFGHGRGMCQWGSARWATARRMAGRNSGDGTPSGYPRQDWKWIVAHYYPDLTLVKGAPLLLGDDVKVIGATQTVRQCADGGIGSGINCPAVTTKAVGATGVILDGPVQVTADGRGFTWYKVQWSDAQIGWVPENWLERLLGVPAPPTALTAAAFSTNQINLTWADNSGEEFGFKIERAPTAGGPWTQMDTVTANVASYADTNGLTGGTTYFYRVRAFNSAGNSAFAGPASATTPGVAPLLAAIGDKVVDEETLLSFTNSATAAAFDTPLTDFESYAAGLEVMFQDPGYSGSTSAFLSNAPNVSLTTASLPTGNSSARGLLVNWAFLATAANPWLRLTTANAANLPNPVIDFTQHVRFRIWCDRDLRVGLGLRETITPAGTPIGANGGQTGGIEWVGVTNALGGQPQPTRLVTAGAWTTLDFDLPAEPVRNFSGGDGVLSTTSGLGVLEHLALVPAAGNGAYTVYLDDFVVGTPNALTYSLDPGAPTNAAVHPVTGVFAWTPTEAQGPGIYNLTVRVTDSQSPPQTDAKSFQVTVNEVNRAPVLTAIPNRTVHAGMAVVFTNTATDADIPANALRFSVDPGAPPGATIATNSGVFSWTTSATDAGTVHPLTVRATDDGAPPLDDAKSFTVTVLAPPTVQRAEIVNGNVRLTWSAIPDVTYRVQFKNHLDDPDWMNLTPDVTAAGPTASTSDPLGPAQRFYRVMVVAP
jgi:hypothetical protein